MRMGLKFTLCLMATILLTTALVAQFKLYEDTFNGGVVTGGYSNGATVPSGSGSFNVTIPPGSTIRRAYLIAGRVGNAPNVTITLNGAPFTFSSANITTTGFTSLYGGNSAVHTIDVTASISAATSAYTIAVPVQNTVSDKYPEFYLYIAFNNPSNPQVATAIYLNTVSFSSSMAWTLNTATPIDNTYPVGLGILGGYAASGSDCENVTVNGTLVGSFSGVDFNASSVWGAMSGFQYYDNVLTGYNDDNANQAISGPDALSNIAAIIPASTSTVPVLYTHCGGGMDNHIWATMLVWGSAVMDANYFNFDAITNGTSGVNLSWQFEENDDVQQFIPERSTDNVSFLQIAEITPSNGLTSQYQYTDLFPPAGELWYRLRYITKDGAVRYTGSVKVVSPDPSSVSSIYPNPVSIGEDIILTTGCGEGGDYQLFQLADGKEIKNGILNGNTSTSHSITISTQGFSPGVYLLKVTACGITEHLRVIVK